MSEEDQAGPSYADTKSTYEEIRDEIVRNRRRELKEMGFYVQLEEAKQGAMQQPSKKKRKTLGDVSNVTESLRRSSRERRPVDYKDEEEFTIPWKPSSKPRGRGKENLSHSSSTIASTSSSSADLPKDRRTLRPRKEVSYNEEVVPPHDGYIWCSTCKEQKFNGCEEHVPRFADWSDFSLNIEPSCAARNSGEGVVNRGPAIEEGTVFGPYVGKFWTKAEYKEVVKAHQESGNAWEIRDNEGLEVVGYIDPPRELDPRLHWMAKINCAATSDAQNLVGFQLHGQIYYRAIKNIPNGKELLTWYGREYAKDLGINVAKVDFFKREENHKTEGVLCAICNCLFSSAEALETHQKALNSCSKKLGKTNSIFCCRICGLDFDDFRQMKNHEILHDRWASSSFSTLDKQCPLCFKSFSENRHMQRHYDTVHAKKTEFKCPTCGREFGQKHHLNRHVRTVHELVRAHKCPECGASFGTSKTLKQHREAIHLGIRFECNWSDCTFTTSSQRALKTHIVHIHTNEFKYECLLCFVDMYNWWGCNTPYQLDKHMQKKHPKEWEEKQDQFRKDNPFVCKFSKCQKRFSTEIERNRHEVKLHG